MLFRHLFSFLVLLPVRDEKRDPYQCICEAQKERERERERERIEIHARHGKFQCWFFARLDSFRMKFSRRGARARARACSLICKKFDRKKRDVIPRNATENFSPRHPKPRFCRSLLSAFLSRNSAIIRDLSRNPRKRDNDDDSVPRARLSASQQRGYVETARRYTN